MTALLQSDLAPRPDGLADLRDPSDWGDAGDAAQAVAEVLAAELDGPLVSVYRLDAASGELVLLGSAPRTGEGAPKGSRVRPGRSPLGGAIQTCATQRSLNYYVEPDFVRLLPGETRSAVAVPVCVGGRALGAIHLEYRATEPPARSDEQVAERVASYLAIGWEAGARAGRQGGGREGRDGRAAEALAALAGDVARSADLAAALRKVPVAGSDLVRCGAVVLLLRHPTRQMLEVVGAGGRAGIPAGALVPIDGTRVGQIFRNPRPTEVGLPDEDEDPLLPLDLLPAPRNAVVVPVCSAGKTVGLLVAVDSDDPAGFAADDVRLLQALADQAGTAEAVRSLGPLRQKISDAALIAEVGRAMTGTLGLDEVLTLVVRSAEMLVSGRCAGVALLSEDGSSLSLVAASGSLHPFGRAVLPTRETIVGWAALAGENLLTEALSEDPRGWPFGDGFGPAALVPLESRNQIRGVLLAARGADAAPLGDDDLDALRKLASYAAIAIENARLYRAQTELSERLQKQTEELEHAYAELRTSQERLLVSEKMAALGRVTAGIAHEINSPLGSILNCLQLATTYAQEYRASARDPDVTGDDHFGIAVDLLESLQLAEEATRRVAQFVRTIKGQTRMEDERFEPFDPAEAADSTIVMLQHELEDGGVRVEADLERDIQLRGDANKFAVVVQNLVSNAVDAYEGGSGVVRVRLRAEGPHGVLEVEDQGSGIPEEIRPRIFDYLFTTKDVGRGTGLGLALVHNIVTSHFRGRIEYRTRAGEGTTFVVTFPLPAEN